MKTEYIVNAIWDKKAQVWVATSDDVPGLVTEAETLDELKQYLNDLIPDLLHENGLLSATVSSVPFRINEQAEPDSVAYA